MDILDQVRDGLETGVISQDQMEDLYKSILAGYGYAGKPTDLTYGGVIQVESLETTLKSVTFKMENIKFYPTLSTDKAYNLVEQYNRLLAYGSESSPYMAEGGAPQEEDSVYVRDHQRIAFFGTRRKVSHQMTIVRTSIGDVVAQQAKEGTMNILSKVERELYWGHAHFMNQLTGNMNAALGDIPNTSVALNGLYYQLLKGDTDIMVRSGDFEGYGEFASIGIDLHGSVMTQDDIERLCVIAAENFGMPRALHAEPQVLSAFTKAFYDHFRMAPGGMGQTVGYDITKMTTTVGQVDFISNVFLRPKTTARPQAVNTSAPAVGAATATLADTGAGNSGFLAGTYQAKVTFVNDFGESAPLQGVAVAGLVADNNISVTIANMPACNYFNVYLSAADGSAGTEKFVGRFRNNGNGAYILSNAKLPGMGEAFLLDTKPEVMRIKQLLPLSKINLAVVATAIEFMIVMYMTFVCYTPRFNGFFKNAGK
jgi:hypothetical protein